MRVPHPFNPFSTYPCKPAGGEGEGRGSSSRAITKRDIFHYVYAMLHHPQYRAKYAENLKREMPRIPLAGVDNTTSNKESHVILNAAQTHVIPNEVRKFHRYHDE